MGGGRGSESGNLTHYSSSCLWPCSTVLESGPTTSRRLLWRRVKPNPPKRSRTDVRKLLTISGRGQSLEKQRIDGSKKSSTSLVHHFDLSFDAAQSPMGLVSGWKERGDSSFTPRVYIMVKKSRHTARAMIPAPTRSRWMKGRLRRCRTFYRQFVLSSCMVPKDSVAPVGHSIRSAVWKRA